jgi:radical SAM protein with 4Fe4S-binding SPASM domain
MHAQIYEMVDYANRLGLSTNIVTNGALLSKQIDELLNSKLDSLTIAFDGFSKNTYEKYRVGAIYEDVLKNIQDLIAKKKQFCFKKPFIYINFIVNSYNEHEVDEAERYFKRLGVDGFAKRPLNLNIDRRRDNKTFSDFIVWLPKNSNITYYDINGFQVSLKKKSSKCDAYKNPIITCEGDILVCCHDIFNAVKIGNVFDKSFKAVWNSEGYKEIRKTAERRGYQICKNCSKL